MVILWCYAFGLRAITFLSVIVSARVCTNNARDVLASSLTLTFLERQELLQEFCGLAFIYTTF